MLKTFFYTSIAIFAFAGNSILCRLALGENTLDAASFTSIRLLSGIIVLAAILKLTQKLDDKTVLETPSPVVSKGSWKAAFMLFLYAITFSFAYISLDTGAGALILFASVQITMILIGIISGNRLYPLEWLGVILAFLGFIYLVSPGLSAPPLTGFILMSVAGIAWGGYTLAGRDSADPLSDTTYNFLRTLPLVILLWVLSIGQTHLTPKGIVLAILSGSIASGIGYTIWYMALRGLSGAQAAVVQLLVPVIAAIGGILFYNEAASIRLIISSLMILGGILTVILGKKYYEQRLKSRP